MLHYLIPKTLRAEAKAGYPQLEEDRKLKGLPALIVDYFAEVDMFFGGEEKRKVDDSDDEQDDVVLDSLQEEGLMEVVEKTGNDSSGRRLEGESTPFLSLAPLRRNADL